MSKRGLPPLNKANNNNMAFQNKTQPIIIIILVMVCVCVVCIVVCVYCVHSDSPGIPPSANTHQLFRGFSFVATEQSQEPSVSTGTAAQQEANNNNHRYTGTQLLHNHLLIGMT